MNNLVKLQTLRPFTRFLVTIGELPTSYFESLTYLEQLEWLCHFIEKNVMEAININAEATEELQEKYIELKSYVDNYFESLDIQEEINNKLDDMAEKGELAEMITAYLKLNGIIAFNTVSDMADATNLIEGSFTRCYGKTIYNDGEGAFYKIRKITSSDVVDGDNIVALTIDNTLIAEKMTDRTISEIIDYIEEMAKKITVNYHRYPTLINSDIESRIYIDGTNGSDDNNGASDSPIKTIDRFFELLNEGWTDIRAYIIAPGEYTASKFIISQCSVHIEATVPGVSIKFMNTESIGSNFYNSHLNIKGYDSTNPIIFRNNDSGHNIYADNSLVTLENVKFDNCADFSMNGGTLKATNLHIPRLFLSGCMFDISGMTLDNNDDNNKVVARYGSNGVIRGLINLPTTKLTKNLFIFERSTVVFHPTFSRDTSVTSGTALSCTYAILHTTQTYINYLNSIADNAPTYSQTTVLKGNATFEPGTYQP